MYSSLKHHAEEGTCMSGLYGIVVQRGSGLYSRFWNSQWRHWHFFVFFFFQAEDGIRDSSVTGVQTCALPIFLTRASLYPFLHACARPEAIELPGQCIYSVPLRTLANQFVHEYHSTVQDYRQQYNLQTLQRVSLQTGERPEDPRFESDLLFTTIDQTLSSFLSIPYALSTSLANFNAGAVLGSYLVFDEFHLFPINRDESGAFAATLHMLQLLRNFTPCPLMTATFSHTLLSGLCKLLNAVEISPATTSFDDIPSQHGKERYFSLT